MENKAEIVFSWVSRALVWGSLLGAIYLLRSFSLLMFLVFVFSYFQANAVERLKGRIASRTVRVVLVGGTFLAIVMAGLAFVLPQLRDQTVNFVNNFGSYVQLLDREVVKFISSRPSLAELLPPESQIVVEGEEWDFRNSTLARLLQPVLVEGENPDKESIISVFETARDIGAKLLSISSQFLLSLLFSFLIVLDLPNLKAGVISLRETKLRYVYDEVSESLIEFGVTLGRAFEAQFLVALANTILTTIGVWFLNIRGELAFISIFVFLCGFIPIAGVFISSIPICLLALANGGVPTLLLAILLITAIHAIESYVLNPQIFGQHMKLNPVVVMILLTISGKLFGVWGLVLCLPIATYLFKYAIRETRVETEPSPEIVIEEGSSDEPTSEP